MEWLKDKQEATPCAGVLYECAQCGNIGCAKIDVKRCSNQAFNGYICLKCGMHAQRRPLRNAMEFDAAEQPPALEETLFSASGCMSKSVKNSPPSIASHS